MSAKNNSPKMVFIVLGLALGLGIGWLLVPMMNVHVNAPSAHTAIIGKIEIVDDRNGFVLDAKIVDSGNPQLGYGLSSFTLGRNYRHTTVMYQRGGETEFVVTVFGPGDDGRSFVVETARISPGPFTVKFDGEIKVSYAESYSTPVDGYYWFNVVAAVVG